MQLEVIHTKPISPSKGTVVLLHGVCFAAWYWEDNFQPWFTTNGYEVIAISYRNHGQSEKKGSLRWRTINEYIEDIEQIVSKIQGPVYLIGHSMGGFLVQHYLGKHATSKIKRAVLLCTVPTAGIWGATWHIIKQYPFQFLMALLTISFKPVFKNEKRAGRLMFSPGFSKEKLKTIVPRMQDESFRANLDMLLLNLPYTNYIYTPLIVIGGKDDFMIPPSAIKKTAAKLHAEAYILNGGHNINMEDGWEKVAEQIEVFFNS